MTTSPTSPSPLAHELAAQGVTLERKASAATPTLERKAALTGEVTDLGDGLVEALVAVTGNRDDGGDVIEPGAFDTDRVPVILANHDDSDVRSLVARVEHMEELLPGDERLPLNEPGWDASWGALLVRAQFDTSDPDSVAVLRKVLFHKSLGWSIGYSIPTGGAYQRKDGARGLRKVVVWEASAVVFGMNREARTLGAKSLGAARPLEAKAWPPLAGSLEAELHAIGRAVDAWVADAVPYAEEALNGRPWAYVEATYRDRVVGTVWVPNGDGGEDRLTLQWPYVVAGDGKVTLGQPLEVHLVTTVVPGGEDDEPERRVDDSVAMSRLAGEGPAEHKAHPADGDPFAGLQTEVAYIAAELEGKAGRVLSSANRQRVQAAVDALAELLAAADPEDDGKGDDGPDEHKGDDGPDAGTTDDAGDDPSAAGTEPEAGTGDDPAPEGDTTDDGDDPAPEGLGDDAVLEGDAAEAELLAMEHELALLADA